MAEYEESPYCSCFGLVWSPLDCRFALSCPFVVDVLNRIDRLELLCADNSAVAWMLMRWPLLAVCWASA
jgi:hypothetical protein